MRTLNGRIGKRGWPIDGAAPTNRQTFEIRSNERPIVIRLAFAKTID